MPGPATVTPPLRGHQKGNVELPPPVFPHRGCSLIRSGGTWHATKGTARLRCSPIRPGGTAPVDMETLRVRLFSHPQRKNARPLHDIAPNRRPRVLTRHTRHPRNTGFPRNTGPSKGRTPPGNTSPPRRLDTSWEHGVQETHRAQERHRPQETHRPQGIRALRNTGPEDTRGWGRPRARGSGPENHV